MIEQLHLNLRDAQHCTGCGACAAACPCAALQMRPDQEGFLRPVLTAELCCSCHRCERICRDLGKRPESAMQEPKVFAAWHKDEAIRAQSSSGGAFSAFAEAVVMQGGVVFGAAYDENMVVRHIGVDTLEGIARLRQSKYVQSDLNDTYQQIKSLLATGRKVLFVGAPCQVAGLVRFLGLGRNKHLIACDFACHGVPSPLFFESYLQWLHSKKGLEPDGFRFRDKKSGWYDALRVCHSRGRNYYMKAAFDCYFHAFNRNLILREACYHCPANGENRVADLTLGDFWGIGRRSKFSDAAEISKGISLICVHSEPGRRLMEAAEQYLNIQPRSLEEALAGNRPLIHSPQRPKKRSEIYNTLRESGFETVRRRFLRKNLKEKIVSLIREFLPSKLVLFFRNRIS